VGPSTYERPKGNGKTKGWHRRVGDAWVSTKVDPTVSLTLPKVLMNTLIIISAPTITLPALTIASNTLNTTPLLR
jgi:hypothetical protein